MSSIVKGGLLGSITLQSPSAPRVSVLLADATAMPMLLVLLRCKLDHDIYWSMHPVESETTSSP